MLSLNGQNYRIQYVSICQQYMLRNILPRFTWYSWFQVDPYTILKIVKVSTKNHIHSSWSWWYALTRLFGKSLGPFRTFLYIFLELFCKKLLNLIINHNHSKLSWEYALIYMSNKRPVPLFNLFLKRLKSPIINMHIPDRYYIKHWQTCRISTPIPWEAIPTPLIALFGQYFDTDINTLT